MWQVLCFFYLKVFFQVSRGIRLKPASEIQWRGERNPHVLAEWRNRTQSRPGTLSRENARRAASLQRNEPQGNPGTQDRGSGFERTNSAVLGGSVRAGDRERGRSEETWSGRRPVGLFKRPWILRGVLRTEVTGGAGGLEKRERCWRGQDWTREMSRRLHPNPHVHWDTEQNGKDTGGDALTATWGICEPSCWNAQRSSEQQADCALQSASTGGGNLSNRLQCLCGELWILNFQLHLNFTVIPFTPKEYMRDACASARSGPGPPSAFTAKGRMSRGTSCRCH